MTDQQTPRTGKWRAGDDIEMAEFPVREIFPKTQAVIEGVCNQFMWRVCSVDYRSAPMSYAEAKHALAPDHWLVIIPI